MAYSISIQSICDLEWANQNGLSPTKNKDPFKKVYKLRQTYLA
jgi:hypothetical protein